MTFRGDQALGSDFSYLQNHSLTNSKIHKIISNILHCIFNQIWFFFLFFYGTRRRIEMKILFHFFTYISIWIGN